MGALPQLGPPLGMGLRRADGPLPKVGLVCSKGKGAALGMPVPPKEQTHLLLREWARIHVLDGTWGSDAALLLLAAAGGGRMSFPGRCCGCCSAHRN